MTTPISSPLLASTTAADPAATSARDKLAGVAKQFEGIFLRQMLSAARQTNFGGESLFGGQAMDTFRQMQDERFADIAADRGAFGLGKMIESHLARLLPVEVSTDPTAATATNQEAAGNGI